MLEVFYLVVDMVCAVGWAMVQLTAAYALYRLGRSL